MSENNTQKRRDFLKKSFLSGLIISSGMPVTKSEPSSSDDSSYNYADDFDWEYVRQQFPLSPERIYLNNLSLGPSPQSVIDTVCEAMQRLGRIGETGRKEIEAVRNKIAHYVNAQANEIALTRNATEGINIAANSISLLPDDEVIITRHEHVGGIAPWIHMIKKKGVKVKAIELDLCGDENAARFKEAITSKTKAIMFSHVLCTTGMRLPAKEIVKLCKDNGIYSVIDGAQALGQIPIDLEDISPDIYIASGHKWIFGPKGTGLLYINERVMPQLNASYVGAYMNNIIDMEDMTMDYNRTASREEYGTRNTPISLGIGAAVDFHAKLGIENVARYGWELSSYLGDGLRDLGDIELLTPKRMDLASSTLSFQAAGMDYRELQSKLRSTPHRCRTRAIYENGINAVRVSCSVYHSKKDMDTLIKAVHRILKN